MKPLTKQIAYKLLAALASDAETTADLSAYGNWHQHLADQLEDALEED